MIRKTLHIEYYGINEPDMHPYRMHIEHCIDVLREALMRRAELNPIPMEFNKKYRTASPVFVAAEHTCRNFDKIRDWAASQYPATHPLWLKALDGKRA
ncbi:hypothetical protein PVAG01_01783 [Phlyctema vagabunda]|uniref:Uncharacterized protein n=1 Tax=Phlyctema vagabunda TaxID=108571 RepID=A0ABR4PYD8_9HELO